MLPTNIVINGNCIEVMQTFPENSIDCVVTDPPYGMSFMGKEWDRALPPKEAFEQMFRVLKPGALAFVMSSPRQDLMARMIILLEDAGFKTNLSFIDWIYKTGFPKAYDVSKGIDKKEGNIQPIIGYDERFRNQKVAIGGKGIYHGVNENKRVFTEPISSLAKKWDGWKSQTGLKPAHEPVLMVYKPRSEKTIVDNVLKWGTGAINVDACRIPFSKEGSPSSNRWGGKTPSKSSVPFSDSEANETIIENTKGRFPANLLVSDKALDTGEITKSPSSYVRQTRSENVNAYGKGIGELEGKFSLNYGDEGGASRYFDLGAWAVGKGFCDTPKPSKSERDKGLAGEKKIPKSKFNLNDGSKDERFDGAIPTPRHNTHPTVKPIKLMAYLIELGCPPNGVVLDPFMGSGTTCIAAKQLGKEYIGIELNEEYCKMARDRIMAYPVPLTKFAVPPK